MTTTNRLNYLLVNPRKKRCYLASCASFEEAMHVVGLVPDSVGGIDHGLVWRGDARGLAVAADGFGLFKEPNEQGVYAIGGKLLVGKAVFYAVDGRGETVSAVMSDMPPITWYQNARAAEMAIYRGEVERPKIQTRDGRVLWEWPAPGGREAVEQAAREAAETMLSDFGGGDVVIVVL